MVADDIILVNFVSSSQGRTKRAPKACTQLLLQGPKESHRVLASPTRTRRLIWVILLLPSHYAHYNKKAKSASSSLADLPLEGYRNDFNSENCSVRINDRQHAFS